MRRYPWLDGLHAVSFLYPSCFFRFSTRITFIESKRPLPVFNLDSSFFSLFFSFFFSFYFLFFFSFLFFHLLASLKHSISSPHQSWLDSVIHRHPFPLRSTPFQKMPFSPHMDLVDSMPVSFWDLSDSVKFVPRPNFLIWTVWAVLSYYGLASSFFDIASHGIKLSVIFH